MAAVIVGDNASTELARQWLADDGCLVFAAEDVISARTLIEERQPRVIIAATEAVAEALAPFLPAGLPDCRLLLRGEQAGWMTLANPLRRRVLLRAAGLS